MIRLQLDTSKLQKKMRLVPREVPKIMQKVVETDARGFVKDIIAITPPSQGRANKESQRRGEGAIEADLLGLKGGRSKEQRTAGVFVVMDAALLAKNAAVSKNGTTVRLFVAKDGTVYGCDRQFYRPNASIAEMHAHHQSMRSKSNGRVATRGGSTRDVGRWKFLNQMVVSRTAYLRYEKAVLKTVGKLAAGFNAAAQALRVSVPAWIKRHGSKNSVIRMQRGIASFRITITNKAKHGSANDLPRRMAYVLESVKRQRRAQHTLKHALRAALKQAGFIRQR